MEIINTVVFRVMTLCTSLDSYQHSGEFAADTQLTPRSRLLLEKLILTQLVKKLRTLSGMGEFIAVFTRARYGSVF
jgi:hypothetical protein